MTFDTPFIQVKVRLPIVYSVFNSFCLHLSWLQQDQAACISCIQFPTLPCHSVAGFAPHICSLKLPQCLYNQAVMLLRQSFLCDVTPRKPNTHIQATKNGCRCCCCCALLPATPRVFCRAGTVCVCLPRSQSFFSESSRSSLALCRSVLAWAVSVVQAVKVQCHCGANSPRCEVVAVTVRLICKCQCTQLSCGQQLPAVSLKIARSAKLHEQ